MNFQRTEVRLQCVLDILLFKKINKNVQLQFNKMHKIYT